MVTIMDTNADHLNNIDLNIITTLNTTSETAETNSLYYYDSALEMKADTNLKIGDTAITSGYYEPNDGGGATYRIVDSTYDDIVLDQKFALVYTDSVNLQALGAKNDGSTLINPLIDQVKEHCQTIQLDTGVYLLSTDWYRDNLDINYIGTGILKFNKYIKSLNTLDLTFYEEGCYIPYLNDELYTAMHLPSEVLRAQNDSWKISSYKRLDEESILKDGVENMLTMGTLDVMKDIETVPDTFTVCIGNCALYGYTGNEWITLTDSLQKVALYPTTDGITNTIKIDDSLIEKKDSHVEITLSKDLWYSNDATWVLHWWTDPYIFAENNTTPSDFQAYIAVHEVWIKETGYDNIFTSTCGIDIRGAELETSTGVLEYGLGRTIKVTHDKRNTIFNTLTTDLYEEYLPKGTINIVNGISTASHFNLYNHTLTAIKNLSAYIKARTLLHLK